MNPSGRSRALIEDRAAAPAGAASDASPRPGLSASQTALSPAAPPSPRRLPSDLLFGGRQEIEIEHRLQVYRLRRTAAGKLILTK